MEGAFWYSKKSSGFFSRNPYDTGQAGIPSLLAFLQDEQLGYVPDMQPQEGYAPYGQFTLRIKPDPPLPDTPPAPKSVVKPNKLGRLIDLEEEP